ncbi:MAG: glycosyltransferase family 9 protein [Phycisphaerae bacterium]|nr:glycosyltransferase family 9 protein [Phycisphaerae bacterium]
MKIVVVYQGALGDTVLLASLLVSLRARWPTAERTLVTRRSFGSLLIKLGVVELAFDVDDPHHSAWFGPYQTSTTFFQSDSSLPWVNCDLLLSAVSSGQDPWAAHARQACPRARILFFEPRPPPHYAGHVTSFHREELRTLRLLPPVLVDGGQHRHGPLLIQPGSGGREKCWPVENFMRLARAVNQAQIPVEFLLGEVELERFSRSDLARLEREFVVYRDMPLAQVVDLLGASRAYLGNDSGISHLAAWVGMPMVVIFGPSNARQWRPVGPQVRVYQSGVNFHAGYGTDEEFLQVLKLVLEVCG